MAESRGQAGEFGMDHFRLYKNWDKISTKRVVKNRIIRKLGHARTEV